MRRYVCVCVRRCIVPRVQGVVYFTRSLVEMENENVVNSAIEYVTTVQQAKMPYRVSPPLLPLTELDVEEENPLSGKFLKYMPSSFSSGCFVATISREVRLSHFQTIRQLAGNITGSPCDNSSGLLVSGSVDAANDSTVDCYCT